MSSRKSCCTQAWASSRRVLRRLRWLDPGRSGRRGIAWMLMGGAAGGSRLSRGDGLVGPQRRRAAARHRRRRRHRAALRHGLGARRAFLMGSDHKLAQANEKPAHRVRVKGFWMDRHHVTNAEFRRSSRPPAMSDGRAQAAVGDHRAAVMPGTPRPADEQLVAGAMVFVGTPYVVDYRDFSRWWAYVPGGELEAPARGRTAASRGWTSIPWCRSATRTRWPMPSGPASACRPRPSGSSRPAAGSSRPLHLGQRVRTGQQADGQRVARPAGAALPGGERESGRRSGHEPGGQLPCQRLRSARHDRQRLAVGGRLVPRRPVRAGREKRRQAGRSAGPLRQLGPRPSPACPRTPPGA